MTTYIKNTQQKWQPSAESKTYVLIFARCTYLLTYSMPITLFAAPPLGSYQPDYYLPTWKKHGLEENYKIVLCCCQGLIFLHMGVSIHWYLTLNIRGQNRVSLQPD